MLIGVVIDLVLLAIYPDVSASGATFAVLPEADGEIGAFTLEVADVVNNGVVGKTALVDVAIEGLMRLSIARKRPAVLDFGFSGRSKDSGCGGDREAGLARSLRPYLEQVPAALRPVLLLALGQEHARQVGKGGGLSPAGLLHALRGLAGSAGRGEMVRRFIRVGRSQGWGTALRAARPCVRVRAEVCAAVLRLVCTGPCLY